LMSRDLGVSVVTRSVWGQVAVLVASISYAVAATFSRRHLRGHPPILQATMVVLFADLFTWLTALAGERPVRLPVLPVTWFALVWLGLLGSCTAYLLYFYLINAWGPTRSSLVAYVFPVIGLLLGIIFLNEHADWRLLVGSGLVVAGIAVVNLRRAPPTITASRELSKEPKTQSLSSRGPEGRGDLRSEEIASGATPPRNDSK